MRLSKKTLYLLLIFITSVKFFNLKYIPDVISQYGSYFMTLILLVSVPMFFKKSKHLLITPSKKWVTTIFFGVFLSVLSCYFFHQQNIITTLIAQRAVYLLALYFVLIYIKPTQTEVFNALKWFAVAYFVIWLYQYIVFPNSILKIDEEKFSRLVRDDRRAIMISGKLLFLLFYYWVLNNLLMKRNIRNTLLFFTILIVFILNSNRGTLFPILLITSIFIFQIRGKYRIIAWFTIVLTLSIILFQYITLLNNLSTETQQQLQNKNYARWVSSLYWFEYPKNIIEYIFGSGYDSLKSSYGQEVYNLKVFNSIYRSDLGIIGYWSMFGLISTVPLYLLIFKVIFKVKKYPKYLIAILLHMLIMPIAFAFWANGGFIFLSLIFYLYDLNYSQNNLELREQNMK